MRALLDVNVLVALLDPEHVKHVAAYDWFDANLAMGWASCPLTENGCLRVMTNPRYPHPKSPAETLARLERSTDNGNHAFWPDDVSIKDAAAIDRNRLQGHQQITDIYLLALAVAHGGRLVTFDQRIRLEARKGMPPGTSGDALNARHRDDMPTDAVSEVLTLAHSSHWNISQRQRKDLGDCLPIALRLRHESLQNRQIIPKQLRRRCSGRRGRPDRS